MDEMDNKKRYDPEAIPPMPPVAKPIPPGAEKVDNPVGPIDPYMVSFAKIPGLRKRAAGEQQ
jgi:hypothetical protein